MPSQRHVLRECIDRQPSEAPLTHYVIVDRRLTPGQQLAQVVHAAGESARPAPEPGAIAVVLHARDEQEIWETYDALTQAKIAALIVIEPCGAWYCACEVPGDGHATAIGVYPTRNRSEVRRVLSSMPLAR